MTPLAMRFMRHALGLPNKWFANAMVQAPTFELSAVQPLIERTARELVGTTSAADTDSPLMEHGGLLFAPAEFTWLEQRSPEGGRFGTLLHTVEDQINYFAISPAIEIITQGFIELQPDDEHFCVRLEARWEDQSARARQESANVGGWVAAALLLINAPHGVQRTTAHPHKGLAREVKHALGKTGLQPVHTIRLAMTPGEIGEPVGPTGGTSKAFHFCRSHLRHLPSGATTRVRAHWRGDPSLGVGQADYRVAP